MQASNAWRYALDKVITQVEGLQESQGSNRLWYIAYFIPTEREQMQAIVEWKQNTKNTRKENKKNVSVMSDECSLIPTKSVLLITRDEISQSITLLTFWVSRCLCGPCEWDCRWGINTWLMSIQALELENASIDFRSDSTHVAVPLLTQTILEASRSWASYF